MRKEDGHILITGSGRAGTTLLVELFYACGFDVGYIKQGAEWINTSGAGVGYWHGVNAGLEHLVDPAAPQAHLDRLPHVIKDPSTRLILGDIVSSGRIKIAHVVLPIRRPVDVVNSRVRFSNITNIEATAGGSYAGKGKGRQPATNLKADLAGMTADQLSVSTDRRDPTIAGVSRDVYKLLADIAYHEVPHSVLHFPRFAEDAEYAYRRLWPVLRDRVRPDQFARIHLQIADIRLIHHR